MSADFTLSGVVLDQGTEKRLSGATIQMETPTDVLFTKTDEDGKFTFKFDNEPTLLPAPDTYEVLLYAYYKEGRQQEPIPLTINIDKGKKSQYVEIKMINRGPVSNYAGAVFLGTLIVILLALTCWYYWLHNPQTNNGQKKVNHEIVNILTGSLVDRITSDSIKVSAFQLKDNLMNSADSIFTTTELLQITEAANELFKASQVDTGFQTLINRNLGDIKQAIERKNKKDILAALVSSKSYIGEIPNFQHSWFWRTIPLVYYEVLLWSLFATLLRLIGNTSYYVSRNTFFRDSIYNKAALLFTIPLIALLIVFVISFFKITVSIGGAEFVLDFSHPYISVILASLIGLAPWKAWEFMYGLADLLFNGLKKWLGLGKPGDEESENDESNSDQQNNSDTTTDSDPPKP